MITKKIFHPVAIFRYLKVEFLFSIFVTVFVYLGYVVLDWKFLSLPFGLIAILGSALAIFLAFRNNNSYARWWEARTAWSGILAQSRIFGRQIITSLHISKIKEEEKRIIEKELLSRQIAFTHALRLTLRGAKDYDEIGELLDKKEFERFLQSENKANFLLTEQGKRIKELIGNTTLGSFDNISIEPIMSQLQFLQATCERIKGTPLLRQYHFFTKLFLFAFLLILPFCLITEFGKITYTAGMIPMSLMIGFIFSVMGKVGEVNEDPFENTITDVPMTYVCNSIERDLREMMSESSLPAKMYPKNGYLY